MIDIDKLKHVLELCQKADVTLLVNILTKDGLVMPFASLEDLIEKLEFYLEYGYWGYSKDDK